MTNLTNEDLTRLEAIEAAATPGPWCEHPNGSSVWQGQTWEQANNNPSHLMVCNTVRQTDDCEFTAEARNALRPLIEEVRRLRTKQVELNRRAQLAESAVREKVRSVKGPHDSRGLGRALLGATVTLLEQDVERLQGALAMCVAALEHDKPALAEEAKAAIEETGTSPYERAVEQRKLGREAAIADVRAYLLKMEVAYDGEPSVQSAIHAICDGIDAGDHEGAAARSKT